MAVVIFQSIHEIPTEADVVAIRVVEGTGLCRQAVSHNRDHHYRRRGWCRVWVGASEEHLAIAVAVGHITRARTCVGTVLSSSLREHMAR